MKTLEGTINEIKILQDLGVVKGNRRALIECPGCSAKVERNIYDIKKTGVNQKCNHCVNPRHGLTKHPLYARWSGMIERCRNPNHSHYHRYGGRGIKVCKEWQTFINFYTWSMSNGWAEELEIDRQDNDLGYYPGNCHFITKNAQYRNKGKQSNNESGYRGVSWDSSTSKYTAKVTYEGKSTWLGRHTTAEQANEACITYRQSEGIT